MQSSRLLKTNIDALLRARHQSRHDLAQWCRRTDAWLSKILSDSPTHQARGLPLKYLDRIADFFGLATYQLFQPGLTGLLERRKGERRSGIDRRLSALNQRVRQSLSEAVASLTQADVADMIRLKTMTDPERDVVRKAINAVEETAKQGLRRSHKPRAAGMVSDAATGPQEQTHRRRSGGKAAG